MKTFEFMIVETLTRVVEIEGEDLQSAQAMLDEMIRTEEVVLDADDFEGRTIIPL